MKSMPFVAYARIVPDWGFGKRQEYVDSMNKIAKRVTDDIRTFVESNPTNDPIIITESNAAATPQFGQFCSRLTIVGFHNIEEDNFQPATKVRVDAPQTDASWPTSDGDVPGKHVSDYTGTMKLHPDGQQVDPLTRTNMLALKADLEAASPYLTEIYRIDYMGVIFGTGYYSFQ